MIRRLGDGLAALVLRGAALLVPRPERRDWLAEWRTELEVLRRSRPREGLPSALGFALGGVRHALWKRREGWTMDSVWQDLRYAVRTLSRAPGFTAVVTLTLALGIGANGSIFALVNGLLFRPPGGIEAPERLVQIARSYDSAPRWDNWSWPALRLIADEGGDVFSGVAGHASWTFVIGSGPEVEQVPGEMVSGSYFDVLGVRPHVGRLLGPADDVTPGAHPVVVLGHGLWQRRFGADPAAVGRTLRIGAEPYTVVGVAPPGFAGPGAVGSRPELWVPAMQNPGYYGDLPFEEWGWSWIDAVGRLREGVSVERARSAMDVVTSRLRAAEPANGDIRVLLASGVGLEPGERAEAEGLSLLLLGVVGLVLLLACTNVASLVLARTTTRRAEVGVRMALGAGAGRVARQLFTESVVLAALATAVAVPAVRVAARLVPSLVPYPLAVSTEADATVYLVLAGMGLLAAVLFGALPAWAMGRRGATGGLRASGSGDGVRPGRLRSVLVVAQLAITLAFLAGAGVLGRSLLNARDARPGFEPEGLTVAFLDLGLTGRYDEASGRELLRGLLPDLEAIPGVEQVTVASQAPLVGGHSRSTVFPEGALPEDGYEAERNAVGPGYFETLGTRVVQGRAVGGLDPGGEPAVAVNRALADLFWPGEDAVGRRIEGNGGTWRVVGVVDDVRLRSLRAPGRPGVYHAFGDIYSRRVVLHLRGRGTPADLPRTVREVVARHDPELPVAAIVDLREAMVRSMGETRTLGYLVGAFGALALVLATVGLYGLVSFGVSRRVREMGIRKALGARSRGLQRMVVAQGFALTAVGLVAGLALAALTGRVLEGVLFGVAPLDPLALALAAGVLAAGGLLAAWIPARRASRVDAAVSLREGV